MAVLQQVINKAVLFSKVRAVAGVHSKEFRELFDAVSQLNAADFSFNLHEMLLEGTNATHAHYAPAFYMNIRENDSLNASVFALRERREIPLHDHPGMHGLLKVIQGKVIIRSYSFLNEAQRQQLTEEWNSRSGGSAIRKLFAEKMNRWEEKGVMPVIEHDERMLTVNDPPTILTPSQHNIHRVQALEETAAFFDILVPPYYPSDPNRDCHYFKLLQPKEKLVVKAVSSTSVSPLRQKLNESESGEGGSGVGTSEQSTRASQSNQEVAWLVRIQPPRSYYCDSVIYRGPEVKMPTELEIMAEMKKA